MWVLFRPIVIFNQQKDMLPQGMEVVFAMIERRYEVRDLKLQPLPVMNLIKHLQYVPEQPTHKC